MDRQQDWREKVTMCSLITGLTILFGFLAFGLALLTCRPHSMEILSTSEFAMRYGNKSENPGHLATIRGSVYDIGSFFAKGSHPSAAPGGGSATSAAANSYLSTLYGRDISALFPPPDPSDNCQLFGAATNFGKCSVNSTAVKHCHSFSPSSNDVLSQFERSDMVITYPWSEIVDSMALRSLFVYDGSVFDATDYLAQVPGPTITAVEISRMYWIKSLIGRDATFAVRRQSNQRDIARCFQAYFKVGVLSGEPAVGGCLASIVINSLSLAILLLITFMRLGSALIYWFVFSQSLSTESGKESSGSTAGATGNNMNNNAAESGGSTDIENHVLMLVTCQATDQEDQIRSTLDSLALTDYDDGRKLLLVMADATWDDDGERSQASLACLRLMQPSTPTVSEKPPLLFSDDPFSEDIYSGYYVVDSRRIPYVLILRTPDQDLIQEEYTTWWKKKLILRWLYRVCFNEPISSFEYTLFQKVRGLMSSSSGVGPDAFDMLLVAEVGIECDRRSLSRMVSTLRRDEKVMGVCAQRVISNASENWLTRVQDYENHLSLQFTSAFESTLGAVHCLPSRFSLVRIKLRCHQGSHSTGHVKLDKRNSDETSIFSESEDDDEIHVGIKNEEKGDGGLDGAGGKAVGGAEGNEVGSKRLKRQRLLRKILASDGIQYSIPILVHPDVISCFVGNKAHTLHERSLLIRGGEDRYLTGLLHQTFPDRRIVYVPQAVYRSTVTPDLRSFLQDQAQLAASSFHTLWRQIWISQLRGRFCCSLNFLALIDWLALVILPSAVIFSVVLLAIVAVGAAEKVEAFDALPVVLALCFMMAVVALQPLLGIFFGAKERSFARNLYGSALFLAAFPFMSLAITLYVCFSSTGELKFCQ